MNELPARTDVAIVGGGFAGCATAWALARRGVRALVIEREAELGRFASGRGAGLGRQLAEDDATSELAVRGAAMLRERFGRAWSPSGGVLGFDDAGHAQAYVARAVRLGIAHELIDRRRVLALWPSLNALPLASALLVPSDGVIEIRTLLHGLAAEIDVAYQAPVTGLREGIVETARGSIAARVIVDASGAWAGSLVGDAPLEAYKRHLFVVEAVPAPGAPYFWHLGKDELYVRGDGAAVLASPCDGEVTAALDQQPSADADARLRARLGVASPAWREARVLRRWACQRAFAADRRMRLGRDPERPWLVWAAALGGHGATAAPAVGEVVADAVVAALGR